MPTDLMLPGVALGVALLGALAVPVWTRLRRRADAGQPGLVAELHEIRAELAAVRAESARLHAERATVSERIEAQVLATRTDLEWLMGDRLMEMADRFVQSGLAPDPALAEIDLPPDMARTIALFRQH